MAGYSIASSIKDSLLFFLKSHPKSDLLTAYLFFLSQKHSLNPVLFIREKTIYPSKDILIQSLESAGKLWRETEIKIQFGQAQVNQETARIYICPFSGKVFGDNTHPNPQDAIYDWVSTCSENTERVGGLPVKKFYISDDADVIANYIEKRREPITKVVYSSVITGKLFNSKKAVIDDFSENQLKPIPLTQVPQQNRFQIEESLLNLIQENMEEEHVSNFIEAAGKEKELEKYVDGWTE